MSRSSDIFSLKMKLANIPNNTRAITNIPITIISGIQKWKGLSKRIAIAIKQMVTIVSLKLFFIGYFKYVFYHYSKCRGNLKSQVNRGCVVFFLNRNDCLTSDANIFC